MKKLLIMAVAACCLAACNKELGPEYKVAPVISGVTFSPQEVHAGENVHVSATVTSEYGFTGISILYSLNEDPETTEEPKDQVWFGSEKDKSKNYKATSATSEVSSLTEISMFTEGDDIPLADVFTKIYAHTGGREAVSPKEAPEKLKACFAEVLPDYDRDRVHVSDIKKCFAWYNILVKAGFTEFKLPAETE